MTKRINSTPRLTQRQQEVLDPVDSAAASAKSVLIETLNNPHSTLRDVYDSLINYLQSEDCFVTGFTQRPSMFEAYMTVIQFSRVQTALSDFDSDQIARFATALLETNFTPLAMVLAAVIAPRAKTL